MTLFKKTIVVMGSVALLSGCFGPKIANIKHIDQAAESQAERATQTPQQACEAAGKAVTKAKAEALHIYAPLHFEGATESLLEGQEQIKKKRNEADGMVTCIKVSKLVEDGLVIKAKAQETLKDAFAELEMLNQVDEEKRYREDIQKHVAELTSLVKKIEAGKTGDAVKGQDKLLKEMVTLEIRIVMEKNLQPVEAMLEQAEKVDADDLAENTFAMAERELERARGYILVNYRNDEEVQSVSALAMRAARHAFYVAQEVASLKGLKAKAAEEKVLYLESLLERINKKLNQGIVIGHSLDEQSAMIGQRLDERLSGRTGVEREIEQLKQQLEEQTNMNSALSQEIAQLRQRLDTQETAVVADGASVEVPGVTEVTEVPVDATTVLASEAPQVNPQTQMEVEVSTLPAETSAE